jgi:O-antigen ligase
MAFAFSYYIASFFISLVSPFWGLVGFICSLLLRFQDHYPQINAIKPFTLLLLGMILSCIINKDKLSKLAWKQDKLILYLFILSVFGLLIMGRSSLFSESYMFLCSISIYYFTSRILQTPLQFLLLFFSMGLSVSYLGYLAIADVALFPETTLYIEHASKRWQGLGYYANSNEFGQLMITTIPFMLAIILSRVSWILSACSILLMTVMMFVMIKCESRTVMVTVALMVVGTFMLRGNGSIIKKGIVGGVMSIIMLAVLTFMPGPIQDRMSTVLDAGNDESFQGRTRSWDHGFAMLSWYPITGVGKGQWMEYHGLMPHNSYVQVMAEMGIPGIILFLMIIWQCLKQFKPLFTPPAPQAQAPPNNTNLLFENELATDRYHIDTSDYMDFNEDASEQYLTINEGSQMSLSNIEKSVAIATFITFSGWLLYIFLGNQGYSIWMYFYLGLCTALANFMPIEEPNELKPNSIF